MSIIKKYMYYLNEFKLFRLLLLLSNELKSQLISIIK